MTEKFVKGQKVFVAHGLIVLECTFDSRSLVDNKLWVKCDDTSFPPGLSRFNESDVFDNEFGARKLVLERITNEIHEEENLIEAANKRIELLKLSLKEFSSKEIYSIELSIDNTLTFNKYCSVQKLKDWYMHRYVHPMSRVEEIKDDEVRLLFYGTRRIYVSYDLYKLKQEVQEEIQKRVYAMNNDLLRTLEKFK